MLQSGDAEGALATMESTKELGVPHPNIPLLIGSALELLATQQTGEATALLSRAKNAYIKATKFHGQHFSDEVLPGGTSWVAATRLAVVLTLLGDPESALDVLERVLKMKPCHSDATMAKIEALLANGETKSALALAHENLTMNTADSWLLAAACCDQLGAPDEAKLFTQKAKERASDGYRIASHREVLMATLSNRYGLQ
jgi:Flp pilus assembly protein TadD